MVVGGVKAASVLLRTQYPCSPEKSPYLKETQRGCQSSLPSICLSQVALEGVGSGCKPAIFPEVSGVDLHCRRSMDSHESAGKVVHQEVIEGVYRFHPGGSRFDKSSSSFLLASFLFADHPLSPPTHRQGKSLGMPFSLHCKPAPGGSLCLPALQGLLPLSAGGS